MDEWKILDLMLSDMGSADEVYRPTNFWKSGLPDILKDLKDKGFEDFRTHGSACDYYVPRFSKDSYSIFLRPIIFSLSQFRCTSRGRKLCKKLNDFLSGREDAELSYKLFKASCNVDWFWSDVYESEIGLGERFKLDGGLYSRSFLNYLLGLNALGKFGKSD